MPSKTEEGTLLIINYKQ